MNVLLGDEQRFRKSQYKCPQCGGEALRDDWPPNYSGGSGTQDRMKSGGNMKHVCLTCKISFGVGWWDNWSSDSGSDKGYQYHDIKPLVERDGKLLTPHDVWRFKYHDEHGEWPHESYL